MIYTKRPSDYPSIDAWRITVGFLMGQKWAKNDKIVFEYDQVDDVYRTEIYEIIALANSMANVAQKAIDTECVPIDELGGVFVRGKCEPLKNVASAELFVVNAILDKYRAKNWTSTTASISPAPRSDRHDY